MTKEQFEKLLVLANAGDAHSKYLVALEYELGEIVDENMDLALELMNEACDLGDEDAKAWLEDYYFDDDAFVQANS